MGEFGLPLMRKWETENEARIKQECGHLKLFVNTAIVGEQMTAEVNRGGLKGWQNYPLAANSHYQQKVFK